MEATFTEVSIYNGEYRILDERATKNGIQYAAEYPDILTNDRSIPDVGTVNILKQTPASYTNAAAPNNTIFYSTTDGKLSYKDPGVTPFSTPRQIVNCRTKTRQA